MKFPLDAETATEETSGRQRTSQQKSTMKKLAFSILMLAVLGVAQATTQAQTFFGLFTDGLTLVTFDGATGVAGAPGAVLGLNPNDMLVDIDVRPSDGLLYGMSGFGTLYSITSSGGFFNATAASNTNVIPGATVIDHNPVPNRTRVYAGTSNFRITPNTDPSVVTNDGPLAYKNGDVNFGTTPTLTAAAYTNSDNDPLTGTTLYSIDSNLNILVLNDPTDAPGFSTLITQGALTLGGNPFDAGPNTGFDILTVGGVNTGFFSNGNDVYLIDVGTAVTAGQLTFLYTVSPTAGTLRSIAVPEPTTIGLLALGALGLCVRRRR